MFFSKSTTAAAQSTNGATDNSVPVAITGLAFSFNVDEPEMWVQLKVKALASADTAGERADLMVKVDTAAPAFVASAVSQVLNKSAWVEGDLVVRLSQGLHTVAAYMRSSLDTKVATLHSDVLPCVLEVVKLSNNAVLAHGVDAKNSGVTE